MIFFSFFFFVLFFSKNSFFNYVILLKKSLLIRLEFLFKVNKKKLANYLKLYKKRKKNKQFSFINQPLINLFFSKLF